MMWRWLKKLIMLLGIGLLIILTIQFIVLLPLPNHSLSSRQQRADVQYTQTPTIMIPGWGGNSTTYRKMVSYYQSHHYAQKVMTVWVSPTGQVKTAGSYHGQKNALIQILYNWNYNASYHPQVHQLSKVLMVLHQQYHINKMNVIAHSYGGTEFMHAYFASKTIQKQIQLHQVILLGVPVEESFGVHVKFVPELWKKSHDRNFQQLIYQMHNWQPTNPVNFYNIMGGKDQEVPRIQSEMLKALVTMHPTIQYRQVVVPHTNHFQLHDRPQIIKAIAHVLWQPKED